MLTLNTEFTLWNSSRHCSCLAVEVYSSLILLHCWGQIWKYCRSIFYRVMTCEQCAQGMNIKDRAKFNLFIIDIHTARICRPTVITTIAITYRRSVVNYEVRLRGGCKKQG